MSFPRTVRQTADNKTKQFSKFAESATRDVTEASRARGAKDESSIRIVIDSAEQVNLENNNPSNYKYTVTGPPIDSVKELKLTQYSIQTTPIFIVARSSRWFDIDDVNTTTTHDTAHRAALALKTEFDTFQSIEKNGAIASIYTTDGLVSLNIMDIISFTDSRAAYSGGAAAFRTYDIFICTGFVKTTSRDGWKLQFPNASVTAFQDFSFSGSASDDATSSVVSTSGISSPASALSVAIKAQNLYLYLDINGTSIESGINSSQSVNQFWKSFEVYYPGEVIKAKNGKFYSCSELHYSLRFANDLSAGKWVLRDAGQDQSNSFGAFAVLEPNTTNETLTYAEPKNIIVKFKKPVTISSLNVRWRRDGLQPYFFPFDITYEMISNTASDLNNLYRRYKRNSFILEMLRDTKY